MGSQASGQLQVGSKGQNTQKSSIFDHFDSLSRFLARIICIYAINTCKQHFLTIFRGPRAQRGPKGSFSLQNPKKWSFLDILKDFEGKMTLLDPSEL